MTRTYRVGIIGFAHMHVNALVDAFSRLPNIEWIACADTVPAIPSRTLKPSSRGASLGRTQEVTGIQKVYDDYRAMLEQEGLDIVLLCAENARHPDVTEEIARHGTHVVTEKPMAANLSGALRMARAAQAHGISLMVNWPTTWSPAIREMKRLIDAGKIGRVWEVKWRNGASMGPLSYNKPVDDFTDPEKGAEWWYQSAPGGGALLDYCCYGACLSRWFLGEQAVSAMGMAANLNSHFGDAEDNAVITVRFPQAMAILEGTWTTWNVGVPTGPIVYGTTGTLVASIDKSGEQPRSVVEVHTTRSHRLTEPDEVIEGEPLPDGQSTPAEAFIHHLESGEPLHPTLDMMQNVGVMAILDAGIRSVWSGKMELVNDQHWCIG